MTLDAAAIRLEWIATSPAAQDAKDHLAQSGQLREMVDDLQAWGADVVKRSIVVFTPSGNPHEYNVSIERNPDYTGNPGDHFCAISVFPGPKTAPDLVAQIYISTPP